MKKTVKSLLVACVTALSCALVCLFTMGSSTVEGVEPQLSINHFNLSFRDNVCVKYAVETNVENTQVLVWREVSDSYEKGTEEAVLDSVGIQNIEEKDHQIFDYTDLYAKNMTDDVYARAYANVDGEEYYSPVRKYSILQYAYNKLGKTGEATEDDNLKAVLTQMLEYGGAVQKYANHNTDRLATDPFVQVQVNGGALPDGFTHGLYKVGSTVTITAPETNANGEPFGQWVDEADNVISKTATYTLTVGEVNATYSPVYKSVSKGLTFSAWGSDTCFVSGIGTCTDTDIVIPSISPDGDTKGSTVIAIGGAAFKDCSSLTSVEIPNSVTKIRQNAFLNCSNLTSVNIPNSVTTIEAEAFRNCSSLASIEIPDSVTEIGALAFIDCSALTKVNYTGTIDDWATISFGDNFAHPLYYTRKLHINDKEVTEVVLTTATKIGDYAFYRCENLTGVTIGNSVTSIGEKAFYYCSSLTSIEIPDGVTSIGASAFQYCGKLTSIKIPNGVLSLGSAAFKYCSSLTSIVISKNITSIQTDTFYDCSSLTNVYYGGTAEQWAAIAVDSNNDSLTNATIYYYSETQPDYTDGNNYWHYVDNQIVIWGQN